MARIVEDFFPYRGKGKEQASLPSLFAYLVATFAA